MCAKCISDLMMYCTQQGHCLHVYLGFRLRTFSIFFITKQHGKFCLKDKFIVVMNMLTKKKEEKKEKEKHTITDLVKA